MLSPTNEKPSILATSVSEGIVQQCCTTGGKCGKDCGSGKGGHVGDSCRCETSCKCKSRNHQGSNIGSESADRKDIIPGDCSDNSCNLSKPTDPTNLNAVTTNGKNLATTTSQLSENRQECERKKEVDVKKEIEGNEEKNRKSVEDRKRCPQSGDCNGLKDDTSIVWHSNQGSVEGVFRSQTREQKVETHASKEEWKLCALTGDDYDHHDKLGLPLPQGDKLKAILFDIDGTIADSDPIHFLAFQEILAEAGYNGGVPISHEFFIRQMSGKLNYVIADELMPEMEEKMRVEMMDEKEARYRKLASKDLQPIPGFLQFIEYVKKRGLRRAAVTNSPRLNAEQVISALNIPDFFEIVVAGSECDNPKPHPDPYLKAIKFLGLEPNQCLVMEDSPSGVAAGKAAGSPVVGLLTGHPGAVLKRSGASVLIQNYDDAALWMALGEDACAATKLLSPNHGPGTGSSSSSAGSPPPVPVTVPTSS
ncbi:uncharacterized protein [Physcomitrium patens]|uniref:uncharacterized protein isoform X2 n=1 Tax=Physcomitrium patens TaxID=3218 RepID=UPI000D158AF5|nr:uncharacterized protein LOC112280990 isoform X2 [Physcomitrium patens]|eukprot:XP_024372780.1 uncharacterized protein LOC112280990 isoform X2 [Physcomitrella patens]